ncbi:HAD-IA family hydrolase [Olivibacter sp. CPCC 100613]|uniref:HAD family hydrolase n=1 Tax=Olivibacter sp. CPCC 100613 TaxID=3079931 RepID=UPI002FF67E84
MVGIKCIIFDCDGVLVDTESIMISVLLEMAGQPSVMDLDEAVSLFSGRQILETIKMLEERSGKIFPANFENEFRKKVYERFTKEVKPIAGVSDLLSDVKLPYCVASSGPREKIELNLGLTGLLRFFEPNRIFSSYEVGSWKPDPGIFLHAANSMGYSPSACAVIEDSLAGVKAGLAGGFHVYAFVNDHNEKTLADEGVQVFREMSELPFLLGLRNELTGL